MGFTTILDPIASETGWSYTQISLAASLRGLESGFLAPLAGIILDRWGPRKLVAGGLIITGLGVFMLGRMHSLAMFYVSFALICAGASSCTPSLLMSSVSKWFSKHVGLAMGLTASGVSFGGLLIPAMTHIVDSYGWRQAMMIVGVGVWLIPLPLSLFLRHKPEKYGLLPDGATSAPLKVKKLDISDSRQANEYNIGTLEALKQPAFWTIAIACMFHMTAVVAITTHIMPFFSSIGVERTQSGFIISAVPIIGVVGRIGFGWIGDRLDKIVVATLSLFITGAGLLVLASTTAQQLWLSVPFVLFFGIGWGGMVPMMPGLLILFFGKNRMGTIVGCVNSVMMVGALVGAPLAGGIFDTSGSYRMAWILIGSLIIAVTVCFYFSLNRIHRKHRSGS